MRISTLFILALLMHSFLYSKPASRLEVKINYPSATGKVVVGASNNLDERVEILISLLDSDGNFATQDNNGDSLKTIQIESDFLADNTFAERDTLNRTLEEDKNIARYVLDYSDATVSAVLQDKLVVTAGEIIERKTIILTSVDASGLIVRVAPYSDFDTSDYINQNFANIQLVDEPTDNNLSLPSSRSPGGSTNREIPLTIYASTQVTNTVNNASEGRFTAAPNLEDTYITVAAVGDFNLSGIAETIIETKRFKMVKGIARGSFVITHGLPAQAADISTFESSIEGGLPIAFIAYAENNTSLANIEGIDLEDINTFAFNPTPDNNATDTIKMHSADPADFKIGKYLENGSGGSLYLDELWSETDGTLFLVNASSGNSYDASNGSASDRVTLTVVDKYDNPAFIVGSLPSGAIIEFDGESTSDSFDHDVNASNIIGGVTINSELHYDNDSNLSTFDIFQFTDKDDNETDSETLTIDFRKGVMASSNVQRMTIKHYL